MTRRIALDRTIRLARTLLPAEVSDAAIVAALSSTSVAIVSDAANAASPAGQSAIVALTQLVLASGCRVRLVMPNVSLSAMQPPLGFGRLVDELVLLALDVIPEAQVTPAEAAELGDLVFLMGDTPWMRNGLRARRLIGGSWWGGVRPASDDGVRWVSPSPVGALTAAVMAAAEPVKASLIAAASMATATLTIPELLVPTMTATFHHLPEEVPVGSIDLGAVDVISAGAITNGLMHGLLRMPSARAEVRVLDIDIVQMGNLNRYPLIRRRDLLVSKVAILQRLRSDGVTIEGLKMLLDESAVQSLGGLSARTVVGADSVSARWIAQAHSPSWLGVGATAGFLTMTSEHLRGRPCAGCLHPRDDAGAGPIPTISFVSYWAGLLLLVRLLRHAMGIAVHEADHVLDFYPLRPDLPTAGRRYPLLFNPDCPLAATHRTSASAWDAVA